MKSNSDQVPLVLYCHPQNPSRAVRGIDVVVGGAATGTLTLTFALEGDLSALCIPEPRPPRRGHDLWHHTCCEAFVMAGEGPGYREFHFSHSGEWAVYAFRGYREGGELELDLTPEIAVRRGVDRLELSAQIRPVFLPPGRSLRLGLSVIVEEADGMLSYWALRHHPGKPDFHHTDSFAFNWCSPECAT